MKKLLFSLAIVSLSVFVGGALAFGQPGLQDSSAPQAAATATKKAAESTVHHVHHVVHHVHVIHHGAKAGSAAKAGSVNYTAKYAAGTQELSGTLSMVDAGQKVLVVTNSDGTPFNIKVTRATRIEVGGKKGTLDALSDQTNKQVDVKYRDRLNAGLEASSITVSD